MSRIRDFDVARGSKKVFLTCSMPVAVERRFVRPEARFGNMMTGGRLRWWIDERGKRDDEKMS